MFSAEVAVIFTLLYAGTVDINYLLMPLTQCCAYEYWVALRARKFASVTVIQEYKNQENLSFEVECDCCLRHV